MSSHAADTPVASTSRPYIGQNGTTPINTSLEVNIEPSSTVASSAKCCKRSTACPPPSAQIDNYDTDRISKRQRQSSLSIEASGTFNTFQSGSPTGEASSSMMYRRPSSTIRDMSPPVDRMVPPINGADCCLGIVACDEQGEIVGWTS
jgi:hypothetical protein